MSEAWQMEEAAESNARLVLPAMARDYFAQGRRVAAKQPKPAKLHPFRLATKRFRYTLEVFRDVYGSSLERKLGLLKPVQDALGEVNDSVATREHFGGKPFRTFLKNRARKKADFFYRAWTEEFDRPGQEDVWVRYLSRVPAKRVASNPKPSSSSEPKPPVNGKYLTGDEQRSS